MPDTHRALVVHYSPGHESESLAELTALLDDGWRIASTAAMGATGGAAAPAQFAALIVLHRNSEKPVAGFR